MYSVVSVNERYIFVHKEQLIFVHIDQSLFGHFVLYILHISDLDISCY